MYPFNFSFQIFLNSLIACPIVNNNKFIFWTDSKPFADAILGKSLPKKHVAILLECRRLYLKIKKSKSFSVKHVFHRSGHIFQNRAAALASKSSVDNESFLAWDFPIWLAGIRKQTLWYVIFYISYVLFFGVMA